MQAHSSPERAIYVDGVGWLDQYGSYVDVLWESNVIYFVRDSIHRTLMYHYNRGEPYAHLEARLDALNSDISEWEQHGAQPRAPARVGGRGGDLDTEPRRLADQHSTAVGSGHGVDLDGHAAAEPVADPQAHGPHVSTGAATKCHDGQSI